MKNLDSDLTEDYIGEDTGGEVIRHRELSVSEIELND